MFARLYDKNDDLPCKLNIFYDIQSSFRITCSIYSDLKKYRKKTKLTLIADCWLWATLYRMLWELHSELISYGEQVKRLIFHFSLLTVIIILTFNKKYFNLGFLILHISALSIDTFFNIQWAIESVRNIQFSST